MVQTKKDIPRIELGLLDSKSNVLTITPYVLAITHPPFPYFAYIFTHQFANYFTSF